MRIFLAGIMQGSRTDTALHDQGYRTRITHLLDEHLSEADVYDPLADHGESVSYDDEQGREVFMHHNRMCAEVDVLLAVVGEASMGTAIEMWQAHRHRRVVVTVSRMVHNWSVKFLSDILYADEEALERAVVDGSFARRVGEVMARKRREELRKN